jgi:hypothetical protein
MPVYAAGTALAFGAPEGTDDAVTVITFAPCRVLRIQ